MAAIRSIWECLAEEPKEPTVSLCLAQHSLDHDDNAPLSSVHGPPGEYIERQPWRKSA